MVNENHIRVVVGFFGTNPSILSPEKEVLLKMKL